LDSTGGGLSSLTIILTRREAIQAMYSRGRGLRRLNGKSRGIARQPVGGQYIYSGRYIHIIPRVWASKHAGRDHESCHFSLHRKVPPVSCNARDLERFGDNGRSDQPVCKR
jgi:hypothetical protein